MVLKWSEQLYNKQGKKNSFKHPTKLGVAVDAYVYKIWIIKKENIALKGFIHVACPTK